MSIHQNKNFTLQDYFNIKTFDDRRMSFTFDIYICQARRNLHIDGKYQNMYSYSLVIDSPDTFNEFEGLFYISFDVDGAYVSDAKYIFCDCDVMNLSGVHANYKDLKNIINITRKKVWLYHYTDLSKYDGKHGEMPDAKADGFAGFVKEGQIFDF